MSYINVWKKPSPKPLHMTPFNVIFFYSADFIQLWYSVFVWSTFPFNSVVKEQKQNFLTPSLPKRVGEHGRHISAPPSPQTTVWGVWVILCLTAWRINVCAWPMTCVWLGACVDICRLFSGGVVLSLTALLIRNCQLLKSPKDSHSTFSPTCSAVFLHR